MAGPAASPVPSPNARPGSRPGPSPAQHDDGQLSSQPSARQQADTLSQSQSQPQPKPQQQLAPGQSPQSTASAPPNKRRRVALACGNCRHRKSRCDGRRPRCSLCIELGCACVYEQAGVANNLTVGRSYLERLEQRLADIESSLEQVRAEKAESVAGSSASTGSKRRRGLTGAADDNDEGHGTRHSAGYARKADGNDSDTSSSVDGRNKAAGSVTSSQAATTASTIAAPATAAAAAAASRTTGATSNSNNASGTFGVPDTAEDSIDGMGAIKFTDEEDWGYFGPSSNIAFLRHISLAMARMDDVHQAMPSPTNRAHEVSGGMSVSRPHLADGRGSSSAIVGGAVDPHGGMAGPGQGAGHSLANSGSGSGAGHASSSGTTTPPTMAPVNIYALPSEARTWSLIREYFQKTGRLLPFVHEATFCATYFALKTSNFTSARRTWLGLLNIILAMATTLHVDTSVSAERRIAESDVYYQRANALCDDKEARRNMSLELVQYLLILGQYLQGTQKSVQAWTVHGLAITTALQLGLQSPKTNRAFPPLECEIRKRVWYGCILLDRTLSMTFGRPSMIHENYLKLALPITDMQIVGQEPQPDPTPPQMDGLYYTATIRLYNVMYRIIDTCYGQNLGLEDLQSDSDLFSHVVRVEADLEAWKAQLAHNQLSVYDAPMVPKDLEGIGADEKISARYIVVLSVRYHNLQILLHRPILEKLLETCGGGRRAQPSNPLSSLSTLPSSSSAKLIQMGLGSVEACIHSAQAIISIVHTIVLADGPRRDLLGAWNYSLFYTFNAALAIFAAMHIARCDVQKHLQPHGEDSSSSAGPENGSTNGSTNGGGSGNAGSSDSASAAPAASAAKLARLLPRWEFVEDALPYFGMAIEALENLDRGNRVVERCVSYLSQLVLVPINPSASVPFPGASATTNAGSSSLAPGTGPQLFMMNGSTAAGYPHSYGQAQGHHGHHSHHGGNAAAAAAQGYPPPHHGHVHPHAMAMGAGAGAGSGVVMPRQPQQLLPMEIDLNEFMLDTDFDLLNMAWLSS
ncbi:hypothetical protein SCUCBS95973_003756 [Sporothrix curviconia]|uniref:Zn(2)-C6 fungal-type domain-containing protein n=1 Tax=Sporothrix curviconia TaxID=1260050 RepID=A0ABP0BI03_9PEZI